MKILFICTHNRCRSILAEAIASQKSEGLVEARSAGSQPAGEVHPLTRKYLDKAGYSTSGLNSKSWEDLGDFAPDCIVTVCDSAAGESCPLWMGAIPKVHWGLADPSKVEGNEKQHGAFLETIAILETRVSRLCELLRSGVRLQEIIHRMPAINQET